MNSDDTVEFRLRQLRTEIESLRADRAAVILILNRAADLVHQVSVGEKNPDSRHATDAH
jgi:hypothetical protein